MPPVVRRVLTWVVAAVAGLVYGAAGIISHATLLGVIPVGLIVALAGMVALLVAARALTDDRWCAAACGVGAVISTAVLAGTGPGGSVLVPAGGYDDLGGVSLGLVWALGLVVAIILTVLWPTRLGPDAADRR